MLSMLLFGWSGRPLWRVDVGGERCEGKLGSGEWKHVSCAARETQVCWSLSSHEPEALTK
jgi:hypothetical protein